MMITETLADQLRVLMLLVFALPTSIGFVYAVADTVALFLRQRQRDDDIRAVPVGASRWDARCPGVRDSWQAARSDAENIRRQQEAMKMARGTIKRLVATKGFGFIRDDTNGQELFFHMSSCERFAELREGQKVTFVKADSLKGPRAESVNAAD